MGVLILELCLDGETRTVRFGPNEEIWIGRSSKCAVHWGLTSGNVSRQHARLCVSGTVWTLENHSQAGTRLNQRLLTGRAVEPLHVDDQITIGALTLRVVELSARPSQGAMLSWSTVNLAQLDNSIILKSALELPELFGSARDEAALLQQACDYLVQVLAPVIDAAYAVEGKSDAQTFEPRVLASASSGHAAPPVFSRRVTTKVCAEPDAVVFYNDLSDTAIAATVAATTRTVGASLVEQSDDGTAVLLYVVGSRVMADGQDLAASYLRLVATLTRQHILGRRRSSMARYFSPRVVELMMRRGGLARAQGVPKVVEATSFFFDLRGFSLASEASAADLLPLHADLRAVMDAVTQEVLGQGGTVIDYQGDGCFAAWGVPFDQAEQAQLAVEAARLVVARLSAAARSTQGDAPGSPCGIGIAKGQVLAGSVGSSDYFKYGILGPSVNTAARLEGLTKRECLNAPILVTREVVDAAPGAPFVRAATVQLAGTAHPLPVYELLAPERALAEPGAALRFEHWLKAVELARTPAAVATVQSELVASGVSDPRHAWLLQRCNALLEPGALTRWDGVVRYGK